jgi:hypothetical protein
MTISVSSIAAQGVGRRRRVPGHPRRRRRSRALGGERDEERVERIVGEPAIETHERAAETFLRGAAVVLAVATTVLLLRPEPRSPAPPRPRSG